jgi:hypothetical protein
MIAKQKTFAQLLSKQTPEPIQQNIIPDIFILK